jgi:hypothetical protein
MITAPASDHGHQLAAQQADARRRQQAGDERDQDRQRQRAPCVRDTRRDRGRDGGAGRHVRDRLEQRLAQPDRVATQPGEAAAWPETVSPVLATAS